MTSKKRDDESGENVTRLPRRVAPRSDEERKNAPRDDEPHLDDGQKTRLAVTHTTKKRPEERGVLIGLLKTVIF